MRILGITETCDLGAMYLRLIAEGHEVKVTVSHPLAAGTMRGLVPRADDWRAELGWVREAGSNGVILFEATGFGALQDELRGQGFQVIGGSAVGERLEIDRAWALGLLERQGLQVAATAEFDNAGAALADLQANPRRCVFKVSASAGETFVGSMPDGSDVAAIIRARDEDSTGSFILMDFVEGVETGIGAYFNGERFLRPACLDWEHKRFFAGDMGELTGEMGTVATFDGSDALFAATLEPLEPMLREAGHVGYVNLNTIINEHGVWPLEFTCRFGYPGFSVLQPLQDCSWADVFERMLGLRSDLPTCSGFSLAVVLTTPPFPYSREEVAGSVGLPLMVGEVPAGHLHLGEVGLSASQLVTSGLYGWTVVVTGTGETIEAAQAQAYAHAAKVSGANLRYRLDIGDKLISGELELLRSWGWLNSTPPSRMESQIVR